MLKFAALEKEFTLAISLHAADEETRSKIIPSKVRYPISEIMDAADLYLEKAGRMVTFEYTLLEGINDRPSDAEKLAKLAISHHAKVNLIPYNSTGGEFRRPAKDVIRHFRDILAANGAHVTIRQERGAKSSAACGQLRAQRKDK
jgi:23S rRNA (adenine2503-C2)-methyltransferase